MSAVVRGGAGAQVDQYEDGLSNNCQTYAQFLSAYNSHKNAVYAPSIALIFCNVQDANETPGDDYYSALCSDARSSDPADFSPITGQ